MADVVVTVPKNFAYDGAPGLRGLAAWIAEGDAAGDGEWSGEEWHFFSGGALPKMVPGDRVYIVCEGKLRGYAPLVRIEGTSYGFAFVRHGDAVAVTIDEPIQGFRGWRYRWWLLADERPFPDWRMP